MSPEGIGCGQAVSSKRAALGFASLQPARETAIEALSKGQAILLRTLKNVLFRWFMR
jgi:hypothetical protein